jgi:hypothetical protein
MLAPPWVGLPCMCIVLGGRIIASASQGRVAVHMHRNVYIQVAGLCLNACRFASFAMCGKRVSWQAGNGRLEYGFLKRNICPQV